MAKHKAKKQKAKRHVKSSKRHHRAKHPTIVEVTLRKNHTAKPKKILAIVPHADIIKELEEIPGVVQVEPAPVRTAWQAFTKFMLGD